MWYLVKHVVEILESCVDKTAMQSAFTSTDVGKMVSIIGDDVKLDNTPGNAAIKLLFRPAFST